MANSISTEIIFLSILGGFAVFMLSTLIAILVYEAHKNTSVFGQKDKDDWLFHDFHTKVYDFLYSGKTPSGTMMGVKVATFERQCEIIHIKPPTKQVIAMKMEGFVCMFFAIVAGYAALQVNTFIAVAVLFSGVAGFYTLFIYKSQEISKKAKRRMDKIKEDLPRYVILLEKAMDLPIDQAIILTAQKFKSPLSEDLIDSANEAALGVSGGWQRMLINLAKRYDLDSFNGLVLDIVNAYNQGNDIKEAITRKGKDLEEEHIYEVEAQDAKTKTIVFIPVILFKLIPIGALIILPMVSSVMGGL